MSDRPVRVRVAPSPTGDPHVGTAYQALYNLAFARSQGGAFVLRIEDTDRSRSTAASETAILESLAWLGLTWDEGPDIGGDYGPYRQSERLHLYRQYCDELLEKQHAYRCYCTKDELDARRAAQEAAKAKFGYDRRCRGLSEEESAKQIADKTPFVVRMKVPLEGSITFTDLLHGEITKDWSSIDDQIILKSDGSTTYHLANVVDDHLMQISHVIRGEEWINSVPKHLLLYKYFGWEPPVLCHLSLLRNNDANKSKLSKRKNPTSINYYRRAGFLPEALVNFLGLMGWSMPDTDEEKFSFDDMVAKFNIRDFNVGGPVFDPQKLRWLNGRYIREDHSPEQLLERLRNWKLNDEQLLAILPLAQPRLETLSDWTPLTSFFFREEVSPPVDELTLKGKPPEELMELFQFAIWELEKLRTFDAESIEALFRDLAERLEIKLKALTRPFYVAMSGTTASTPLFKSMAILGSDLSRMRLKHAIDALGGLSSKKLKAATKRYQAIFPG